MKKIQKKPQIKSKLSEIIQQAWAEQTLSVAKSLVIDHISASGIKEVDRTRIVTLVTACESKFKLDYYLANSLLKFEGLSANQ